VHGLVTAGGLTVERSEWEPTSKKYLFPVEAMREVYRAKLIAALGVLYAEGAFAHFDDFDDPEGFERLMRRAAAKDWVVYAKRPFREVGHVLRYLGRYTHRVAIANSRLVNVTDSSVSFRTKEGKVVTLEPVEFLRRFVQHVLPDGFHKIRHYGLYSASLADKREQARKRLSPDRLQARAAIPPASTTSDSWIEPARVTGRDVSRCPTCDAELVRLLVPNRRRRLLGGSGTGTVASPSWRRAEVHPASDFLTDPWSKVAPGGRRSRQALAPNSARPRRVRRRTTSSARDPAARPDAFPIVTERPVRRAGLVQLDVAAAGMDDGPRSLHGLRAALCSADETLIVRQICIFALVP
jgi:hypothetical protein